MELRSTTFRENKLGTDQLYTAYAEDDHKAWEISIGLFKQYLSAMSSYIWPAYLRGFELLNFDEKKIPNFESVSQKIKTTGWQIECVEDFVPAELYFDLMAKKQLCVSRKIRSLANIDYAPQPDMIHDIFGHLPFIFVPQMLEFMSDLASLGSIVQTNSIDRQLYNANHHLSSLLSSGQYSKAQEEDARSLITELKERNIRNPSEYTLLQRLYLWTVEFGLMREENDIKIIGAGLITSQQESMNFVRGKTRIIPLSISTLDYEMEISDPQAQLFVAENFDHYYEVLAEFMALIEKPERKCANAY